MAQPKPGDKVKVKTKDKTVEGTFMPSQKENVVIIKLDNGYNMGFKESEIKSIKVTKKMKEKKETKKKKVKPNKNLKNITILHTGGTIASKVDYKTGGVVAKFSPQELLAMFPELKDIANFDSKLISNMWSDDLRFEHFKVIAQAIEKEIKKGTDGIIIGIGTDNLSVASAALSFIIEQTPVPILLVGAQRSSDRGSSDAAVNLVCASEFITQTDFAGVALCMHKSIDDKICSILPACKTKKLHTSRRDAFQPVNDTAIAEVNYQTRKINFIKKDYPKKKQDNQLILKPDMEEKVAILKIHINMHPEQFELYKDYKGLIIEGTGLGHTPGHSPDDITKIHKKFFPAIKKLIKNSCLVVMTSNCLFGRVDMNVYNKGRDLLDLGVIPGQDMLPNTAFIKLAWLLGNYKDKDKIKELLGKNLRGEINSRLTHNKTHSRLNRQD